MIQYSRDIVTLVHYGTHNAMENVYVIFHHCHPERNIFRFGTLTTLYRQMKRVSASSQIKSGAHVLFTAFQPAYGFLLLLLFFFHSLSDNVVNAQFIAAISQIKFIQAHMKMTETEKK